MKRNPEIEQELWELSPAVANLSARMPFQLPEGYFERFPEKMLYLMRAENEFEQGSAENTILEAKTTISGPFIVPEGYFEGLSANILQKISENSTEPVKLNSGQKQSATVISIGGRKKWLNYAAAAVITAFLAGTIYLYSTISGNDVNISSQPMAEVEKFEKDSLQLSPEALSGFLDQTDGLVENDVFEMNIDSIGQNLAILEINEMEIRSILEGLQDDAISNYISEYPDTEAETN